MSDEKKTKVLTSSANVTENNSLRTEKSREHLSAPEDDKVRATGSISVPDTHQCQDKRLALHLFWVVTPHADLSVCLHMVVGFNFSH